LETAPNCISNINWFELKWNIHIFFHQFENHLNFVCYKIYKDLSRGKKKDFLANRVFWKLSNLDSPSFHISSFFIIIILHIFHLFTWKLLNFNCRKASQHLLIHTVGWLAQFVFFCNWPEESFMCCLLLFLLKLYLKLSLKWQMVFCHLPDIPLHLLLRKWAWQWYRHVP